MKSLSIISILPLVFSLNILAQEKASCPTISVSSVKMEKAFEPMKFTANIKGAGLEAISYRWTVSNGTIASGQGTLIIEVDLTGVRDSSIEATIELQGLAKNCINKTSNKGIILKNGPPPTLFDEYGKLSFSKEKIRLDAVAREMKKNTGTVFHFILYDTKKDLSSYLQKRISNISNYLSETHKIPKERFQIVFGGTWETLQTRIWIMPILNDPKN